MLTYQFNHRENREPSSMYDCRKELYDLNISKKMITS